MARPQEAGMRDQVSDVPRNPNPWPVIMWFRFQGEGLPITLPALPKSKHFRWRRLCGVQIGRWFSGAIEGGPGTPWSDPALNPPAREGEGDQP